MRLPFAIFALIITLWSVSLYFYNNPIFFGALEWLKITIALTMITVLELFYFIIAVSGIAFKKFKIPLMIFSVFGLVAISVLFLGDDMGGLTIKKYLLALYPQSAVFILLLFVYAALGAAILLERYLKSSTMEHLRATYVLVGFGTFLTTITILYVFLPLMTGQRAYLWLGPILALIFVLFSVLSYYSTKKVQKKEEVEKLSEEWEKLGQTKEQFLLSLQHHLRTPLTPIKGYLEKILDGTYGREENPVIREKLIEMKKLTDTLYSLIESLLDIQELRIGKRVLNLEDCQIGRLIEGIMEELKPEAEQKGLYLKLQLPDHLTTGSLPTMKLNKRRIREAIWNLVDNAIKYTRRGGVTIKLKIQNEKLKMEISDTGIGMERKEIDYFLQGRIFERGLEAKKLYGPGRGIGLSLAIEFIKAHQGRIFAESAGWGKGTTFFIELPIKEE